MSELTEVQIVEVEALKQQLAAQVEQSEFLNSKHSEVSKSYKLLQQQFDAEVQERKLYKASFVELLGEDGAPFFNLALFEGCIDQGLHGLSYGRG